MKIDARDIVGPGRPKAFRLPGDDDDLEAEIAERLDRDAGRPSKRRQR